MAFNNSAIIVIIVVAFAFYLVYSQNNQNKSGLMPQISHFKPQIIQTPCPPCQNCERMKRQQLDLQLAQPNVTKILFDPHADPYSDAIKKQDMYGILDPLTYPQLRLPREILEKYNQYYDKNGVYPPFEEATRPLFDNPILNGILIKQVDENEPFNDNIPSSVPLFRVKSAKNIGRFFYYIIDQRYLSKIELKIPLDHIKVNGIRYNNADINGLPELYDGDIIENCSIYPGGKFRITLYKTFHFP